jgi:hypothetical protein
MSHSFSLKFIHRKSTVNSCIVMVEKPTLKLTFQDIFVTHFLTDSVSYQHGDFASHSVLVEQMNNDSSFT